MRGQRTHRFTINTMVEGVDAFGGPVMTPSSIGGLWGRLEVGFKAGERYVDMARDRTGWKFWVIETDFRTDIEPEMILIEDGRQFRIQHVEDPDGRRRQVMIYTVESDEWLMVTGVWLWAPISSTAVVFVPTVVAL